MSTPFSSLTPYCTPAQFVERFDARTAGDLLSDETPPRRFSLSEVLSSTVLADLLLQASGEVESACLVADRYTPTDLQNLTGASQQMLIGITAGITGWFLLARRPNPTAKTPGIVEYAVEKLQQLRSGEAIFGILEVAQAGLLQTHVETAREVDTRYLTTIVAGRFFGRRSNQLDPRNQ